MNEQAPVTPRVSGSVPHAPVSRRQFLRLVLATSGGLAGLAAVSCAPSAPPPAAAPPTQAPPAPAPTLQFVMTTPTPVPPAPTAAPTRAAQPAAAATAAPAVAPTAAPAATAASKPVSGGKVVAALHTEFSGLDPAFNSDYPTWSMMKGIYNGLYNLSPKLEVYPELAESMPVVSDNGTRYTIKLRKGVKFHHGREMTADDVVYSFWRVLNPKMPSWGLGQFTNLVGYEELRDGKTNELSGVKALDPYTVEIRLKQPLAYFLHVLTHGAPHVVPKDVAERLGGKMTDAVGTGAFKLKEWVRGQRLVMVRNPDWFLGPTRPYLDEVEYQIGVEPQVALLRMLRGEIDYMVDPPPPAELANVVNDPKYKDYRAMVPMIRIHGLGMSVKVEPFTKLEARQAVAHALNVDKYISSLGGTVFRWNGWVPAGYAGANPDLKPIPYDPAKSKELMQKAGLGSGVKTELWYEMSVPEWDTLGPMIQQDLKQIGMDVELRRVAVGPFSQAARKDPGVPLMRAGYGANYPEVADVYSSQFGCVNVSDGGTNRLKYCNPKLDEMKAEADKLYKPEDQPKRLQMYQEIEKALLAEYMFVPFYQMNLIRLRSPRFKGHYLDP
ncbi:MAG: ABC transporter substrate-binding protein, partial [Chloroflexi bacterium]|nr:ABC transporter substrate-binding protein [Chloroflexota bacterium]